MNPKNDLQELLQKRQLPLPCYSLLRQSPNGVFTMQVTVTWKGETLHGEGEGRKKKEAEMEAARSMLAKLRTRDTTLRSPPPSCVRGELVGAGFPSPCSPTNSKGRLQELLQQLHHPPPEYRVVRGSMNQQYTIKCVAMTYDQKLIAEGFGSGRKKMDAEKDAAEKVYPLVESTLLSGRPLSNLPAVPRHVSPPPEVSDPDLDGDIMVTLDRFKPRPFYQEGVKEEGGASNWLCLLSAEAVSADSLVDVPVTSCGMGETQSQALRDAACHLIDNLIALGYPVQ